MSRFETMGLACLGAACAASDPPPQQKEEAAVVFRAAFVSEPGVSARVVVPVVADGAYAQVLEGLSVDGGTAVVEGSPEGTGLVLEGKGTVEARFAAERVKGISVGEGAPEAELSRPVPGKESAVRYVRVNKGGQASVKLSFEYSARRNCGAGCGGERSWTYEGTVGLSLQEVEMSYTESKR